MTSDHVAAIRKAAHDTGYSSVALATTLQFALTMRQKDVVGEWVLNESDDEGGIIYKDTRWVNGLTWADIDEYLILRKVYVKTGFAVGHDLKLHPDVLAEIALCTV